ncbi:hypothetical protein [Staphylospora marina]|uniref:hypothetical protein n=1 Tax=Staphylospora marina TaxID=2490858 RepID=UPI0013DDF7AB|nr:hypothetical protein [Staphylospora marina]
MENTPKFNVHQPPDPQTGQVNQVWVELDPGDGSNFQTHRVARVTFDGTNWKIERQTWVEDANEPPKADLESAVRAAIKMLAADWAAGE